MTITCSPRLLPVWLELPAGPTRVGLHLLQANRVLPRVSNPSQLALLISREVGALVLADTAETEHDDRACRVIAERQGAAFLARVVVIVAARIAEALDLDRNDPVALLHAARILPDDVLRH